MHQIPPPLSNRRTRYFPFFVHQIFTLHWIIPIGTQTCCYLFHFNKHSLWPRFPCQLLSHFSVFYGEPPQELCLNLLSQISLLSIINPLQSSLHFYHSVKLFLSKSPVTLVNFQLSSFLDPSAAFYPVDHSLLLNTLFPLGFQEPHLPSFLPNLPGGTSSAFFSSYFSFLLIIECPRA